MANIQPFDYQKRTNIEEHNQLVNKVNEIVEVINDTNLDTINSEIATLQSKATATDTEITNIKNKDAMQDTEISNIKNKDAMQDTEIQGITKSLVSDAVLMNGTTTGNMKVRIERTDAPSIDSNDYNIQKPVSVELVQGSASAMVKAQITLSDGTVLISDDFMFTTEAIGTDVYISSFVFKNGNIAGSISADIGLSNGSTLTANNFVVPTDPNVITSISDLQSRMTAVESETGEITNLKATVDGHTTSINKLNTDVADLKTNKADVNNGNQSITAGSINANDINKGGVAVATVNDIPDISGKVNIAQGIENAGKVLGIGEDGNVTPVNGGSGGEVWEEVDLQNFPNNWIAGDRIKIEFKPYVVVPSPYPSTYTSSITTVNLTEDTGSGSAFVEYEVGTIGGPVISIQLQCYSTHVSFYNFFCNRLDDLNSGSIGIYECGCFNGSSMYRNGYNITPTTNYIKRMWKLKQSA